MKRSTIIVLVIILIFILGGIAFYIFNKSNNELSNNNSTNIIYEQNSLINSINNTNILSSNTLLNNVSSNSTSSIESELTSFSTNLSGDNNRLENIRISCEVINGHVLNNGETFSFNEIVGKPTADKGYKEADVIIGTETKKALGGGNCQVSTTLYNAALNVSNIEIIERNPHKKKVGYIEEGKDASVSYGTLDLKFKNNTGSKLKIYMNSENKKVTAKIVKLD